MQKRRGKQPVKPDLDEALKKRLIYLKGQQFSTMNIPIIYRRTFDWESDSVIFNPINKRAFVVYRSDIEEEENDQKSYIKLDLDVNDLPWYPSGRVGAQAKDRSKIEELKETLVSMSLTDRYIHVDVKRPEDRELDRCLREDLESLSDELGYDYSTMMGAYRCTFRFPNLTGPQLVTRAISVLRSTIGVLRKFIDQLLEMECPAAGETIEDIAYSIKRSEINMDRIHTDALNVHWDRPRTEPAGYFLQVQSLERAHDEIEYLVDCSIEILEFLNCNKNDDVMKLLYDEFISLWRSSIGKSLDKIEVAMDIMGDPSPSDTSTALSIIKDYRQKKQNRSSMQDRSITDLTNKIEGLSLRSSKDGGMKLLARKEAIGSIELLFGMNQSAVRLMNLSKEFATKQLYIDNSILK